jgi:hypothetical protein
MARYSRKCRTGLSQDRPNMCSVMRRCERPITSVDRRHAVAWARQAPRTTTRAAVSRRTPF